MSCIIAAVLSPGRRTIGQEAGGLANPLRAIVGAQEQARRRLDEAPEAKADAAIADYLAETARNTDRALDLIRAHPADPAVVEAARFVITTAGRGPGDQSYRAMEILLDGHVADPGMGELCGRMFHFAHAPVAERLIRATLATHSDHAARGLACHSLATLLGYRAGMVRAIHEGRRGADDYAHEPILESTRRLVAESDPAALDRESASLLERCVAEFSDVPDWFTPRRSVGAIAEGELFALRHLGIGQVAPEIEGKDHEGKPFKLGDYRGKVVVVVFSASWCGPCVGMYPEERALAKKLEGRPFALLGVNADADVGTLKAAIASGEITWRCWWDGGMDGPITTRWGVSGIPETYLIDAAGVIRRKNLRGEELERAVLTLLDGPPAGPPSR
ncbi:TlpA family protein disulfide reductase [Tundrisphaera sp. TA3]|uniref:TlpA family protein disulfide reductase n=1 Tax=Tundrisphaera sp. TA3 TaxID=3435775 RepID=UPI003EBDB895